MRYTVNADGTLTDAKVLFDATSDPRAGAPDGMKVDQKGNIYSAGPGGVWIFSPEGKHLGTLDIPERVGNVAWGGADHKTLYVAASSSIYRISLKVPGVPPHVQLGRNKLCHSDGRGIQRKVVCKCHAIRSEPQTVLRHGCNHAYLCTSCELRHGTFETEAPDSVEIARRWSEVAARAFRGWWPTMAAKLLDMPTLHLIVRARRIGIRWRIPSTSALIVSVPAWVSC